jgi:DNA-binding IclR family transcriptional regulator
VERVALQRELAAIRDQGWAAEVEESVAEVSAVAAPIRDGGGYVVAAVGIEGETGRMCDERSRPRAALVALVTRAGRSISRELGHGRDS